MRSKRTSLSYEIIKLLKRNKKGLSFKEILEKTNGDRRQIVKELDLFPSEWKEANYYIKDKDGKRIKVNRWIRVYFYE
jgi:hypothetical protein